MDAEFWLQRWQRGEIGFHLPHPHPKLERYWLQAAKGSRVPVLVPLCGKSLDMIWLSSQGHGICAVELSDQALAEFASETALPFDQKGDHYFAEGWQLHCGDWFAFEADEPFSLFYDRAALIALPAAMRSRYVRHLLGQLAPGARGLLITLEYAQTEMDGPPFSVLADEVRQLFRDGASAVELDRAEILAQEPRFRERGLTSLQEVVWQVTLE